MLRESRSAVEPLLAVRALHFDLGLVGRREQMGNEALLRRKRFAAFMSAFRVSLA